MSEFKTDENFDSTKPEELGFFVGKHMIYTYDNGWQYEVYIKNPTTIDYRIHSGIVGGRWVRDQTVHLVALAKDICKLSWDEPTGTAVSLAFNFTTNKTHGTIFFPQWIKQDPKKTVCYQNDHIPLMLKYRAEGPTYPKFVIDEFSTLTFIEDCGENNEEVINRGPESLDKEYTTRRNV